MCFLLWSPAYFVKTLKHPQIQRSHIPIFQGAKPHCLGERLNGIQEVSGSIPLISTKGTYGLLEKILKSKDFRIFSLLLP